MSDKRPSLEIIAPSVDEAVQRGLAELGVEQNAVEIEVLDEGNRGLFGLGSRQARIRITLLMAEGKSTDPEIIPAEEYNPKIVTLDEVTESVQKFSSEKSILTNEDIELVLDLTEEVVTHLLDEMRVKADVKASFDDSAEVRGRIPVRVDINGSDLSILIGPQAETLNALQYISSLIVSKKLGHSIPIVIDVEGYRLRREQQLRHLAKRMADQAIKTGRRQVLEPMPANERRIIHLELRDFPSVETESIGIEPKRKVSIIPK